MNERRIKEKLDLLASKLELAAVARVNVPSLWSAICHVRRDVWSQTSETAKPKPSDKSIKDWIAGGPVSERYYSGLKKALERITQEKFPRYEADWFDASVEDFAKRLGINYHSFRAKRTDGAIVKDYGIGVHNTPDHDDIDRSLDSFGGFSFLYRRHSKARDLVRRNVVLISRDPHDWWPRILIFGESGNAWSGNLLTGNLTLTAVVSRYEEAARLINTLTIARRPIGAGLYACMRTRVPHSLPHLATYAALLYRPGDKRLDTIASEMGGFETTKIRAPEFREAIAEIRAMAGNYSASERPFSIVAQLLDSATSPLADHHESRSILHYWAEQNREIVDRFFDDGRPVQEINSL